MKTHIVKRIAILLAGLLTSVGAYAIGQKVLADHTHADLNNSRTGLFDLGHSGGLDRFGGHYDRATGLYHFHR